MNAGLAAFLPDAADVDSLVGIAMRLAGMIHIEDPAEMWELADSLAPGQFRMVLGVLAAMVDIDKTPDELLGWAGYKPPRRLLGAAAIAPPSVLMPGKRVRYAQCGTQRGWDSHADKGDRPCDESVIAHEVWDRQDAKPPVVRSIRPETETGEAQAMLPIFTGAEEAATPAVRHVAANLPAAVKAGDVDAVLALLSTVTTAQDATDLVVLLARCADWARLNAETDYAGSATPGELHACFVALRKRGIPKDEIASYICAGETEYQRQSKAGRVARRRAEQEATSAA